MKICDPVSQLLAKYKHMYQLSNKEIAEKLELSDATVSVRLRDGGKTSMNEFIQMVKVFDVKPREVLDAIYGGMEDKQ